MYTIYEGTKTWGFREVPNLDTARYSKPRSRDEWAEHTSHPHRHKFVPAPRLKGWVHENDCQWCRIHKGDSA
jgi:hypothetical protein